MTRWRLEVFRDGEDEPFVSHLVMADRYEQAAPAVMSELSVRVQVAAEDEQAVRIELRREPRL